MNFTSDRIRSLGWFSTLVVCGAVTLALTLRVNAVKSQVHDVDKSISWVKDDIDFLQTEFQARSNQQALKQLNDLEFGYKAPGAGQYIEGERQLAALGVAPGPNAPAPIRYAHASMPGSEGGEGEGPSLLAMVSPVSGATAAALPEAVEREGRDPEGEALARESAELSKRLARIEMAQVEQP